MNYIDKYKGQYGRNSLYDILSLNPNIPADWEIINREYRAVDIDKVIIDGDTFTNYGDFQFVWEKSYVKSPSRSAGGAMPNLNSHATFVTPHLILNFSIMSIDDYRAIMRKDLERNEFVVECYDPIYNKRVSVKMYFATPQMAKLYTIARTRFNGEAWEEFVELAGVQGYTVELIGTNNDLDLVSVVYHLNPPADTGIADQTIGEEDVYKGEEIAIGASASAFTAETFNGKYKFTKWNISSSGGNQGNYMNDYAYAINSDLVLYAQWEPTTDHILSFSYGLADPAINESTYTYETSRTVVQGKSIGTLPTAETPKVKAKNLNGKEQEYTPYYNAQWWKVPQKVKKLDENGNDVTRTLIVTNNTLYWSNRDSTIYLLYDVSKYSLNLYLDGSLYQANSVEYNTTMNLPLLVKSGYTFDGWYYTSNFKKGTKFSGLMPPYDLTLYARWVEE